MKDIASVRRQIDALDRDILKLLGERRKRSVEAARAKEKEPDWFRDRAREAELLANRIQEGKAYGLDSHLVATLFAEILEDSLWQQQEYFQKRANEERSPVRVAFQGIEGSYSHLAALKHFARKGGSATYLGCHSFKEVVDAVEKGTATLAVLPIENTTSGGINEVYDLLLHAQVSIVGEIKLKVDHCLLGLPDARIEEIERIYCHPQTVIQCSNFISRFPNARIEYFADTALSGRKIKEEGRPTHAAIASEEAARIFGLSVLERKIANQEENYTRFIVASRKAIRVDSRIPCKTSIVMMTGQQPGSLLETLMVFRDHGINLTKLESRPIIENPWEEMFYLDFEGNLEDENVRQAVDDATRTARFIKVLGCYPSQDLPAREVKLRQPSSSAAGESAPLPRSLPSKERPKPNGYRLASRDYKEDDTVIEVKGARIGGPEVVVIAGPCAVESLDQIMACAREVKQNGGQILRGGCFKPRTSPYSFQGLGYDGLDMLVEAGKKFGLPIVTEVLSPEDVARVAEKADILQIGARNMQNFTLLSEAGRARRPVMLKRGMSSSLEELLQAAEYILAGGNQQVFLCERGIRTFET
ncbi:MAG TPA: prephenate dehydratase domain-containing protein, partial [Vicinamibacteria bacterium]|nr:prephenate dehydratase domain-containing protein [Vicinamibacteria bacterium]